MLTTAALMAAAKQANGIPSNYRLARVIGASDNTLFRWNTGRGVPDDEHAVKLADLAGLDRGYVIAAMRALREPNPELRAIWAHMAERLAASPAGPNAGPDGSGGGSSDDGPEFGPSDASQGHSGALMDGASRRDAHGTHIMRSTPTADSPQRRAAKAALARLRRAAKKSQAH